MFFYILIFFYTMSHSHWALAQATSPRSWFQEYLEKNELGGHYPLQVAIFSSTDQGKVSSIVEPIKEPAQDSFLSICEPSEFNFMADLNPGFGPTPKAFQFPSEPLAAIKYMFQTSYADTVIHAPVDGRWTFYRRSENSEPEKSFAVKGPETKDAASIYAWISEKLGYSGVVIDRRKQLLLVGIFKAIEKNGNAILLEDSENSFRVKKSEAEGGALARAIDCQGMICIFELLITKDPRIKHGSKTVF